MSMNPTGDERGMTLDDILAVFALDFEQVLVMQYVAPQPMRLSQVLDELLAEWEHPATDKWGEPWWPVEADETPQGLDAI